MTEWKQTLEIIVNLSGEDRARLDKIIELLGRSNGIKPAELAELVPAKVEAKIEPPTPEPQPEPSVTIDDVRLLVQKLATPSSGKRDAVRALVMQYAKSVSDIPDDKLDEVHAELVKLDKGE